MRQTSPQDGGVSISIYEPYNTRQNDCGVGVWNLTTVGRSASGAYVGTKFQGSTYNGSPQNSQVVAEPLSSEETAFIFNIHDPALRPSTSTTG